MSIIGEFSSSSSPSSSLPSCGRSSSDSPSSFPAVNESCFARDLKGIYFVSHDI